LPDSVIDALSVDSFKSRLDVLKSITMTGCTNNTNMFYDMIRYETKEDSTRSQNKKPSCRQDSRYSRLSIVIIAIVAK